MIFRRVKYPYDRNADCDNNWFTFGKSSEAVKIQDDEIEERVNTVINNIKNQLEHGVEAPFSFVASGDTIVIGFFSQDCEDDVFDDDNYFTVVVAKNYEEGTFFIDELKKEEDDKDDGWEKLIAIIDKSRGNLDKLKDEYKITISRKEKDNDGF